MKSRLVGGAAVTPSDSTDLTNIAHAIYVGGAGNIALTTQDGSDITLNSVPVGSVIELSVKRVKSTGTTATNLVALY